MNEPTSSSAPALARSSGAERRIPSRTSDYELTSLGVTLHETIQALVTWTESHQNEIAAARAAYDARAAHEAETAHAR
jgi:DNA-binding HxlR family transcriptional regulator